MIQPSDGVIYVFIGLVVAPGYAGRLSARSSRSWWLTYSREAEFILPKIVNIVILLYASKSF